jgi:hypothetical protein
MNIVYSFVGTLPEYSVHTVYQLRLFYTGPVYFILDDHTSPYVKKLQDMNVLIIHYNTVMHLDFMNMAAINILKFVNVPILKERSQLFMRSFERFYILYNLMLYNKLDEVFFLELDNLVYNDPMIWLPSFQKKDMAFMFDNIDRCSSGICYIKNKEILNDFLSACTHFISTSKEFMSEMTVLYRFYNNNFWRVQMLPILWEDSKYPKEVYENKGLYDGIFDAASLGIYIGGLDTNLTGGLVIPKAKMPQSLMDYSTFEIKWEQIEDIQIPMIKTPNGAWIRVNNLHLHSKILKPYLSKPMLE